MYKRSIFMGHAIGNKILAIVVTMSMVVTMSFSSVLAVFAADGDEDSTFVSEGITYEITSADNNLVSVGDNGNINMENVVIPKEVTNEATSQVYEVAGVVDSAFDSNKNIKSVDLSNLNFTDIESSTFNDCSNLQEVKLPETVTFIGANAFSDCKNLGSFSKLPNLKSMGGGAFSGCIKLGTLTLPDTVTKLAEEVFKNCINLKKVTLPEKLTEIGNGTFENCKSLEKINFPVSLESIDNDAFAGCTKLTVANWQDCENITNIGSGIFTEGNIKAIYLPKFKDENSLYIDANMIDEYNMDVATEFYGFNDEEPDYLSDLLDNYQKAKYFGPPDLNLNNSGGIITTSEHTIKSQANAAIYGLKVDSIDSSDTDEDFLNDIVNGRDDDEDLNESGDGDDNTPDDSSLPELMGVCDSNGICKLKNLTDGIYKIIALNQADINSGIGYLQVKIVTPPPIVPPLPPEKPKVTEKDVTLLADISLKSIKAVVPKDKTIKITWKETEEVDGYKLTLAENSKFTKGVKTYMLASNSKSKTIKSLKKGKLYYIKINGYLEVAGDKVYSSASKTIKIPCIVAPKKMKAPKVTVKKKNVTVKWKKYKGASGYQIVISKDKKFKKGVKCYNVSWLRDNKILKYKTKAKLYIKIRAYKKIGKNIAYGMVSSRKYIKVK